MEVFMIKINRPAQLITALCGLFCFSLMQAEAPHQVVVFSHGLGSSDGQAVIYSLFGFIPVSVAACNYPEVQGSFDEVSLFQEPEISILKETIQRVIAQCKNNCKIVLYGLSRGSNVIINFLAKHLKEFRPYISGVVLESPFISLETLIDKSCAQFAWYTRVLPSSITQMLAKKRFWPQYDKNGLQIPQAISMIEDKDLPILIIGSYEDTLIPVDQSEAVSELFKEHGHTKVETLFVEKGAHANIIFGESGIDYLNGLYSFYQKYGLIK